MPLRPLRATLAALATLLAACDATLDDPDATHNIEARVTGLQGTLRLYNAGAGILEITGNGEVTIATRIAAGSAYNLVVARQPYGQTCTLSNGSGVAGNDMATVQITCDAAQYPIGVTVSGTTGSVVLTNGSDTLTTSGSGNFATPVTFGETYAVTLDTEPVGHACTLTDGSGTATGQVINVNVACTAVDPFMIRKVTVAATGPKFLTVNWQSVPGATHYKLMRDNDGIPGGARTQVGTNTAATTLTDRVAIHLRTGYLYSVDACDALRCVESVPASATGALLRQAIGYFKADWHYNNGYFGWRTALSSDGQTLAVGSTGLGTYAFVRPTNTYYWKQQGRLALSAPGTSDALGYDLTLSADGRLMAVSALGDNGIRIYERNLGVWGLKTQLVTPGSNTVPSARLSMSADGNVLAVAGPGQSPGCIYIYRRSGNAWNLSETITCDAALGYNQSSDVAISADGLTVVVSNTGDRREGTGVNPVSNPYSATTSPYERGAAWVFAWSGTAWALQATLKPVTAGSNHYYGKSVSISANGNVVAVGVPGDANSKSGINPAIGSLNASYSGAVYVYARSGTTWAQNAYIKAYVIDIGDNFGHSVSLSGDGRTLAVGAPYEDSAGIDLEPGTSLDDSASYAGAAYVFTRGSAWKQARYVKAPQSRAEDRFGYSVSLSSDAATLAVGAIYESGDALGINGQQGLVTNIYAQFGATYLY